MKELIVPKSKPASPDTWEISQELPAATLQTTRIPLDFPEPYLVVGAYVSVIATSNTPDLRDPTVDDLLVFVDLNNQRVFTSSQEIGNTSVVGRKGQFVTLGSLDTRFRDLHIILDSPKPILGFQFRWKVEDDATREALYQDCIVSIATICVPIRNKGQ